MTAADDAIVFVACVHVLLADPEATDAALVAVTAALPEAASERTALEAPATKRAELLPYPVKPPADVSVLVALLEEPATNAILVAAYSLMLLGVCWMVLLASVVADKKDDANFCVMPVLPIE